MDLVNFGGASTLLCIDFLKLWGGQWPPWPPGSGGPAMTMAMTTKITTNTQDLETTTNRLKIQCDL